MLRLSIFNSLPAAVQTVFSFIVTVLLCYVGLWILAWMMYWAERYGFLPWP